MQKYSLGIDIGTTSICALALADNGETLAAVNSSNNSKINDAPPFARLQSPEVILRTANELISSIKERFGVPSAIGITGQMHGIVYIDEHGNAVSPLYTWQDARGSQIMHNGETYVSYISRTTGYHVASGYGLVTHFYNAQNGEVPKSAKKLCTIHDYLAMKLASRTAPLMHTSDAASLGLYDITGNCFDTDAIKKLSIDPSFLPDITSDITPIGDMDGVPVYPAIGDNQASFLGSVGNEEGTLLINIGTGSQVSIIGSPKNTGGAIECRPFIGGRYLLVGSSLCGGRAYAVLERFFRMTAKMCGADIDSAYPFMDKFMNECAEDSKLTVSTLFDGTRQDPDIRGSISGISTENLTPGALMDGFMRGIAEELYSLYTAMGEGCEYKRLIGSGNGLRKNACLCRTVESVFGAPLTLSKSREEAALGAARLAMDK